MNERAREVLVEAVLRGVKQTTEAYKRADGSMCAAGVLLEAAGVQWMPHPNADLIKAFSGVFVADDVAVLLYRHYDITPMELSRIVNLNDLSGWDFLTIARKLSSGGDETGKTGEIA